MNRWKCGLIVAVLALVGCSKGSDWDHPGRAAIERHGCTSCHIIPTVRGPDALVGPPLVRIGGRTYIAGAMINSPVNLALWLKDPQAIRPGSPMPNLRLSDEEAREIASFLETLR